jgi:hypothetical protein
MGWTARLWIVGRHLDRLEAAGWVIKTDRMMPLLPRWRVTDATRLAQARDRLDLVARSTGPADPGQFAYAGLICVIKMDRRLYRGLGRHTERARLREVATGKWTTAGDWETVEAVGEATAAAQAAASQATAAAVRAATDAALRATEVALADIAAHGGGGHGGGGGGHH